jgi:hypothetical protein
MSFDTEGSQEAKGPLIISLAHPSSILEQSEQGITPIFILHDYASACTIKRPSALPIIAFYRSFEAVRVYDVHSNPAFIAIPDSDREKGILDKSFFGKEPP